jgi:hypothetical protein
MFFNTNPIKLITYNIHDFAAQFFWSKFILKYVCALFIETEIVSILRSNLCYHCVPISPAADIKALDFCP